MSCPLRPLRRAELIANLAHLARRKTLEVRIQTESSRPCVAYGPSPVPRGPIGGVQVSGQPARLGIADGDARGPGEPTGCPSQRTHPEPLEDAALVNVVRRTRAEHDQWTSASKDAPGGGPIGPPPEAQVDDGASHP